LSKKPPFHNNSLALQSQPAVEFISLLLSSRAADRLPGSPMNCVMARRISATSALAPQKTTIAQGCIADLENSAEPRLYQLRAFLNAMLQKGGYRLVSRLCRSNDRNRPQHVMIVDRVL
jgi:hypothetical protein